MRLVFDSTLKYRAVNLKTNDNCLQLCNVNMNFSSEIAENNTPVYDSYYRFNQLNLSLEDCKSQINLIYHKHCLEIVFDYFVHKCGLIILIPLIMAIGIIGNIICIITLANKQFTRTSTGFILLKMALLDICKLITVAIYLWRTFIVRDVSSRGFRESEIVMICLMQTLRQISSLMICVLTVERTIGVYSPLHCTRICSRARIMLICFLGCSILIVINLPALMALCWIKSHNNTLSTTPICSQLNERFDVDNILRIISSIIEGFIPLIFLIAGNTMIIAKLSRKREEETDSNSSHTGGKRLTSTMAILIVESVVFGLTNLPGEIFGMGENLGLLRLKGYPRLVFYVVFYALMLTADSLNFMVYMVVGRKFRTVFRESFESLSVLIRVGMVGGCERIRGGQ